MALFLLTYDVCSADHDYSGLCELLEKWQAAHLLNSVWLVERNSTATAVLDEMEPHMHCDDTIAAIELAGDGDWAAKNVRDEGVYWLSRHLV